MTAVMYATIGAPGSGKSTAVRELVELIRIGKNPIYVASFDDARTTSGLPANCVADDRIRINIAMDAYGEAILRSGASIVFDETHARRGRLHSHARMAARLGAKLVILDHTAVPLDTCRRNVRSRAAWGGRDVPADKIGELHAAAVNILREFVVDAPRIPGLNWRIV